MKTEAEIIEQHEALHGTCIAGMSGSLKPKTPRNPIERLSDMFATATEQKAASKRIYITQANKGWLAKLPAERINWALTLHADPQCSVGLNHYIEENVVRANTGLIEVSNESLKGVNTKRCHKCK